LHFHERLLSDLLTSSVSSILSLHLKPEAGSEGRCRVSFGRFPYAYASEDYAVSEQSVDAVTLVEVVYMSSLTDFVDCSTGTRRHF
jgi:hypothetical protein